MRDHTEIAVLGAGIIGICSALQLQRQGFTVTLVDRSSMPGRETSYGNAGLIQPDAFSPILFPRDLRSILGYASNRRNDCVYQISALRDLAPILFKYWRKSSPSSASLTLEANLPLFASSVEDHFDLARESGSLDQFRPTGWTRVFRKEDTFTAFSQKTLALGVGAEILSTRETLELEPGLLIKPVGAVRLTDQLSLPSPLQLSEAYFNLFIEKGGRFVHGDANSLAISPNGKFSVLATSGTLIAEQVVICLGPWTNEVLRKFGITVPLFVKRGYAVHFNTVAERELLHSTSDADGGYSLTPMKEGIRLNTGVEFASHNAPPSRVQLNRVIPIARKFFPLGNQIDIVPWVGSRPCLPDMRPVIGQSKGHRGLWCAFGHAHHGLTLAASSGRLLAQMIKGTEPFTNPHPFALERFA